MEFFELLKNLPHTIILYYVLLLFGIIISFFKGKEIWKTTMGEDGKPQINEVFQIISLIIAYAYLLLILFLEKDFNIQVLMGLVLFSITGDIHLILQHFANKSKTPNTNNEVK